MSRVTTDQEIEGLELELFLEALYRRYDYDFRGYARTSMTRRLVQARQRFGCQTLSLLQDKLLRQPQCLPALIDCLTIQVSEMFREPEFFRALREHVVPHLKTYPSLRVWVAGCGEGEELYSLAILFREENLAERTLFYATDLNARALEKARAGIYPLDQLARYSENHRRSGAACSLSEYYYAAQGAAVFDKSLRQQVVFAEHSLVSDAVFAEVQLVCCRNVLIYFDPPLKERAIGLFREALARKGFLALGAKETLRFSPHAGAFDELAGACIFQKSGEDP